MTRHQRVLLAVLLLLGLGACRAPGLTPTDSATPTSSLPPTLSVKPSSCVAQYDSPVLGFSVEHPCHWEVAHLVHGPCTSDPNRLCDALNFQTRDAHANSYGVTVFRYWPAVGETVTDTVEYGLRTLAPSALDQITSRCCVTVGGKPAMQWSLQSLPEDDHRDHRLTVVHNGAEYMLIFWWSVPFQPEGTFDIPPLSQAQDAFDAFLRSFTFVPISETPTPPPPVPTAAPTPTQTVPPSP